MKKLKILGILLIGIIFISACGSDDSEDVATEKKDVPSYDIVLDEKAESTEQRKIRVTTDAIDEADFKAITEEIMTKYEDENLDSMHFYLHAPDGDSYGALKASVPIAYTQRGVALTGIDEANSYKIEMK